jgi:hypothetical protein
MIIPVRYFYEGDVFEVHDCDVKPSMTLKGVHRELVPMFCSMILGFFGIILAFLALRAVIHEARGRCSPMLIFAVIPKSKISYRKKQGKNIKIFIS